MSQQDKGDQHSPKKPMLNRYNTIFQDEWGEWKMKQHPARLEHEWRSHIVRKRNDDEEPISREWKQTKGCPGFRNEWFGHGNVEIAIYDETKGGIKYSREKHPEYVDGISCSRSMRSCKAHGRTCRYHSDRGLFLERNREQ